MDTATLIPLLTDADLSASSSTPVVVYGQPIPFIHKAKSLQAFAHIYYLSTAGTTQIKVEAEYSVDGVTWRAFTTPLLDTTSATLQGGTPNTATAEYGPLVRFNVSLTQANGGAARLTVVVNVRYC